MSEINMSVPLKLAIETAQDLMGERDDIIKMATARESVLNEQIAQLTKERDDLNYQMLHISAELQTVQEERDQLAAKCAEMRDGFEKISGFSRGDIGCQQLCDFVNEVAEQCTSDQCGDGWIGPENRKVLVEALKSALHFVPVVNASGYYHPTRYEAEQALEACK